jgi:hypothetical protein
MPIEWCEEQVTLTLTLTRALIITLTVIITLTLIMTLTLTLNLLLIGATLFENTVNRAEAIALAMRNFSTNLHLRKECSEQASLNEVVKVDYEQV